MHASLTNYQSSHSLAEAGGFYHYSHIWCVATQADYDLVKSSCSTLSSAVPEKAFQTGSKLSMADTQSSTPYNTKGTLLHNGNCDISQIFY